jgi:uncharacterized Ntn-hydrolase superfamily protein
MTFSIVARDIRTGEFGIATATGLLAVGALVPHAAGGIGAIATQGYSTNPFYGIDGLELLGEGLEAERALSRLTAEDAGRHRRQAIIVDNAGRCAGWTGEDNVGEMGHQCFPGFAVAGNMLTGTVVLEAMATSFRDSVEGPVALRLLDALRAGERAGGDSRKKQSAALLVVADKGYPTTDLRVDDHPQPLEELARLLALSTHDQFRDFLARLPTRENPGRS